MIRALLAISFGALVFLAGCATQRSEPAAAPAQARVEEAATPATPPVKVSAAASRRVVLYMTGPKNVVEAKDWAAFKQEWRDTFAEHAKLAGIGFSFVEADIQPNAAEDGTFLQVTVNDYRMVGIAARIFFGVMTGNAFIDARVRFVNLRDGNTFGEQQHSTSSNAWSGVVAKVTPQQVDAIAADVFKDIKAAR